MASPSSTRRRFTPSLPLRTWRSCAMWAPGGGIQPEIRKFDRAGIRRGWTGVESAMCFYTGQSVHAPSMSRFCARKLAGIMIGQLSADIGRLIMRIPTVPATTCARWRLHAHMHRDESAAASFPIKPDLGLNLPKIAIECPTECPCLKNTSSPQSLLPSSWLYPDTARLGRSTQPARRPRASRNIKRTARAAISPIFPAVMKPRSSPAGIS